MFLQYFTTRLVESTTGEIFHISVNNLDSLTVFPHVPNNSMVSHGYEDGITPRISFAPTIGQCLRGMAQDIKGMEFFVHIPVNKPTIVKPTAKQVPDVAITGEIWSTTPVMMKCIGKIRVTSARAEPTSFKYGNGSAQSYAWNYQWLTHTNTNVPTNKESR